MRILKIIPWFFVSLKIRRLKKSVSFKNQLKQETQRLEDLSKIKKLSIYNSLYYLELKKEYVIEYWKNPSKFNRCCV